MRKVWWIVTPILLVGSCAGLFPVSWHLSDQLVNRPIDAGTQFPVLLVWPNRIEIRQIAQTSVISPRPADAAYHFRIPSERLAWVEGEVRRYPSRNPGASWLLKVHDLEDGRQRVQLELFGDGIRGVVYDATDREIVPVYSRLTGPGFAFTVLKVNVMLWSVLWLAIYIGLRAWKLFAGFRV